MYDQTVPYSSPRKSHSKAWILFLPFYILVDGRGKKERRYTPNCLRNNEVNLERIYINTVVNTLFIDIPMDFQGGYSEALGQIFYVDKPDSPYAGGIFGPKFLLHIRNACDLDSDISPYYGVHEEGYDFREFESRRQEDPGTEETNGNFDSSVSDV